MKKINKILMLFILCITFNIKALAASPELVVSGGELGTDYTYEDGVVSINNSNSYEISMADGVDESSDQIVINYSDTLKNISLTLNNVNLKSNDEYNILINYPPTVTEDDLKVNLILKGNNSLVASHHPYKNPRNIGELIISSDGGTLTTEATAAATSGYNNLNSAKVTLESGTVTMKNQIIMTTTGIYIKGGTLNITSQDECLYSNGEIIISGGNTTLTSDSGCAINMVGRNTSADKRGLKIIGDANLDITTKKANSTTISAGTNGQEDVLIDTTGKVNINSKYIGIALRNNSNLTVNNGTLNINGPAIGIYAYQSAGSVFTVNGGETEIASTSYGVVLQSATQKTITFGDEYFHKNYHGDDMASRTEVSDGDVIKPNAISNKYVLITPAYKIEYDLGNGSLEEGKENPTKYTRVDTFTLNNPIPNDESYIFVGWTGTDVEELTKNVTISENNTGNRSYVAHYIKHIDGVEATCTEDGNVEYYYDETNDKYYTDETLQNEITKEETIIPATGHDWGEWIVTKEPTATETGLMVRKCKNDPDHVETEIIPALDPENRETDGNPKTSFIGNVINNLKTNHNNIIYIALSILSVAGIGYTIKTIKENK